jgi:hypothetical protein
VGLPLRLAVRELESRSGLSCTITYSNWKVSNSLYADGVHKHLWQPDTYFDSCWSWKLPGLDRHIPVRVEVQFAIWCGHLTAGVLVVDLILIYVGGHCEYSAVLGWQGPLCLGLLCLKGSSVHTQCYTISLSPKAFTMYASAHLWIPTHPHPCAQLS